MQWAKQLEVVQKEEEEEKELCGGGVDGMEFDVDDPQVEEDYGGFEE